MSETVLVEKGGVTIEVSKGDVHRYTQIGFKVVEPAKAEAPKLTEAEKKAAKEAKEAAKATKAAEAAEAAGAEKKAAKDE